MAINKIFIKRVKISGVLITNFLFFGIVFCILLNISFISAVTNCNTQGSCSGSGPFNTCSDSYHCTNSCNNCYQLHVNTAECKIIAGITLPVAIVIVEKIAPPENVAMR